MIFVIKNVGGKRCHTNCFAKKGRKFIMNTNQISCFLEAVKENNFYQSSSKTLPESTKPQSFHCGIGERIRREIIYPSSR